MLVSGRLQCRALFALAMVSLGLFAFMSWQPQLINLHTRPPVTSKHSADMAHLSSKTVRPFSLPLPAAPASTSSFHHHPLTTAGNDNDNALTETPGKPTNLTISGFVFYGRRDRIESMHCYVERNLVTNGGWLDNVIWVVNTEDKADLDYLQEILSRSPLYKTHVLPEPVGWPDFAKIWRMVDRETMYIKIDDDIVWFADDAIERIVTTKLARRDALAVSANIINNPPLGFLHYHMGALHPYFPEIPGDFDPAQWAPQSDFAEDDDTQDQQQQQQQQQLQPPDSAAQASHSNIAWRPSQHPFWTGPDDFEWSLDFRPPPPSRSFPEGHQRNQHRWLRVPNNKALNQTPVAELTYEVWGPTYESWAIAAQQHYSLLENIEREQLELYKFEKPWDMKGERIRINFMAVLGSDILDTDVFHWPDNQGDEDMIVLTLPHDLGRPILVEGTALAAHFNFMHQAGVAQTDLLARYKSLAAERACLGPAF